MRKVVVCLLGLLCLGFLSCQSLPLLEFSEKTDKWSSEEVCFVLEVNHSDLIDFWEVEIEWLPIESARKKAEIVEQIKKEVYSIHEEKPRPSNDQEFLAWDEEIPKKIRERTSNLKKAVDEVFGSRETIVVDREKYWWLSWGVIFKREFIEAEEIDEGVWRHNFYRYIAVN